MSFTRPDICLTEGNPDLYGLGIRLSQLPEICLIALECISERYAVHRWQYMTHQSSIWLVFFKYEV